jgi:dienelactone hydrolase
MLFSQVNWQFKYALLFHLHSPDDLQEWLQRVGDWETIVKPDLINLVEAYKDRGVNEFAIFGMCWGGKVATLAATELKNEFKAAGLVHPSSVTNEEANGVQIPMYLMPTASEPDMVRHLFAHISSPIIIEFE